MDAERPVAASTGFNHLDTGMFIFATRMFTAFLKSVTQRDTKLPFGTFGNATARLRPRYRDGHSPAVAEGDGYRAR
jgi:hypothetical protein